MDVGLKTSLMETFVDLYKDVYDKYMPREMGDITIYEYFQSWKLRGDNPDLYKELDNKKFNDYIKRKVKLRFDRYELNDKIPKSIRETEKYRWLYYNYHFTEKVRTEGDKIFEFKVDNRYAKAVRNVQDGMIRELVNKGIGIETNPSSNYLIGTIERYDEHPIIRFNSRKLKKAQDNNMSLSVSINTDDQGVFDTSLENEYALMTLALKKAKDENNNPLYDIEDIYEWIDYVREMGIEQVFR
jgi:signal peptidase I